MMARADPLPNPIFRLAQVMDLKRDQDAGAMGDEGGEGAEGGETVL